MALLDMDLLDMALMDTALVDMALTEVQRRCLCLGLAARTALREVGSPVVPVFAVRRMVARS
jgi:hypothetical protein